MTRFAQVKGEEFLELWLMMIKLVFYWGALDIYWSSLLTSLKVTLIKTCQLIEFEICELNKLDQG